MEAKAIAERHFAKRQLPRLIQPKAVPLWMALI
jgi:hypothetical protein